MHYIRFFAGLAVILCAFLIQGCEKEQLVQPKQTVKKSSSSPSFKAVSLSYDETATTTTTQWPAGTTAGFSKGTGDKHVRLKYYAKTHRNFTADTLGNYSVEVEYTESDADLGIPLELYNRIKDNMHPRHPQANPIKRYTIINDVYTAYGVNGSVISTETFTMPSQLAGKITSVPEAFPTAQAGERVTGIFEHLKKNGVQYQMLGDKEAVYEEQIGGNSEAARAKIVFDISSGLVSRMASYNKEGKLADVQLTYYKTVSDFYVPHNIVIHRLDKLANGEWGMIETTVEQRTNIAIVKQ